MTPSISEYFNNSNLDISTYVKSKRIGLAHEITDRTKIYLDTKYWVLLRDVRLGRSNCPDTIKLLNILESRVANRTLICPLNAEIFLEVMKQEDKQTLITTAQLIDELSLGVCILPFHERIELELYHFIESSRNPQNVYKLNELAWSKIGYILGFLTPISNELPKDIDLAFQKYYADHIWTITLVDMLNVMEFEKVDSKIFHNEDITYELNKGKFENQDVHGSFKSVYLSEIQGILDVHRDTISNLLENIYLQDTGKSPTNEEKFDTSCYQMLSNLIYSAFRLNKIRNQLPSIRIGAGLHAAVRWDKHRKYQATDLYDFKHAIAALPYFDLFFTECSLCHLVDDGNLKYKDLFACKTVYKPSDALSLVVK